MDKDKLAMLCIVAIYGIAASEGVNGKALSVAIGAVCLLVDPETVMKILRVKKEAIG